MYFKVQTLLFWVVQLKVFLGSNFKQTMSFWLQEIYQKGKILWDYGFGAARGFLAFSSLEEYGLEGIDC